MRLRLRKSGTGTGTIAGGPINCGGTCSATLNSGTAVTLSETPDTGSTFGGWSGPCTGTQSTCSVTVTQIHQSVLLLHTNQQSDTQAPSVPTNLTAAAVSSSEIGLSWTASTDNVGVVGYKLYRCQGAGCTRDIL